MPDALPEVLVVEDAEGPRVDLVDYLSLKGFQAAGVGSGAEARQALAVRLPDVIVLDIGLPDGNGFDLARDIRSRYGLTCGIIMLTGFASVDDRVEGLASGADIYLVKHASLREIEANIRGLLRRRPRRCASRSRPVPRRLAGGAAKLAADCPVGHGGAIDGDGIRLRRGAVPLPRHPGAARRSHRGARPPLHALQRPQPGCSHQPDAAQGGGGLRRRPSRQRRLWRRLCVPRPSAGMTEKGLARDVPCQPPFDAETLRPIKP